MNNLFDKISTIEGNRILLTNPLPDDSHFLQELMLVQPVYRYLPTEKCPLGKGNHRRNRKAYDSVPVQSDRYGNHYGKYNAGYYSFRKRTEKKGFVMVTAASYEDWGYDKPVPTDN